MRPTGLLRPPTSSRHRAGPDQRRLRPAWSGHRGPQSATSLLGPAHPLIRATQAVADGARQWRICAAVLAGAIIARLEDHPWATALSLSAGIVLLTLSILVLALVQRLRDRATELIAEGRETLPIAVVQRQRQRLLTPKRRKILARTLDTMVRQATTPPKIRTAGTRPLFDPRVVASVAADLRAVIASLETQHAHARGVALTEQLIIDGGSPLYGHNEKRLREELHRVRYLLDE
jgi:hypothetical protein